MAVSFKGLTIKFGGDTTGLQGALKSIQKETRNTQSDLREINKSLKFNPGNTELLAQKVRALNKAYDETKQKLEAYKQAMAQLEAKKESGEKLTEEESRQYDALQRAVLACEGQLESYAEQLKDAGTEAEAAKTKVYQLGQKLEDNADSLKKHGERMEKAGKVMVGASTAITTASLAAFGEVDAGLDAVIKKTGATGEAADGLGESVKKVATTLAGSSTDWETLGNAVGEVNTRFGFTGQDLEDCSEKFLKFGQITGTDTVTAIGLVSRAMGDAGIDASEYSSVLDALAKASQNSGIEVDKLATLLTSYGAPMRALGFDTESAIAIFSQWELAGVNTETAFSGMKKAISNWSKEGKDARVEFGKTLKEIADCPDIASATTKAIEVFGAKAGPDLADAIQGGRFEYEDFLKTLKNSKGTVDNTFQETVDGVDEVNRAQKELQTAGAELGEAFSDTLGPIIHDFAGMVHDVAEAFSGLSPEQKEFVVKATLMTGAAGVLTLGLGKVFQAAGDIGGGLKGAATAWTNARTKLADMGGISGAWSTLTTSVGGLATTIGGKLSGAWTGFTGLIAAHPIALGIAAVAVAVAGLTWFFTQTETGKKMWADFTSWISEKWKGVQEFFKGIPGFWSGVWGKVTAKTDEVKKGIGTTWDGLKRDAGVLKSVCSREWESMKTSVSTAADNMKKAATDKFNQLKTNASTKWGEIKKNTSAKWNEIKTNVTTTAGNIKNAITDKLSAAKTSALGIFDSIKNGIKDKINAAKESVKGAIDRIKGFFKFSWSLPKLKLPHPTVSGSFSLNPPSVPHFGLEWYAKGNGVFEPNRPRLIGVGDNRTEREYLNTESQITHVVEDAMRRVGGAPSISVDVNVNATITGRQSSYEVGQDIGRGITSVMKQRGVAYA